MTPLMAKDAKYGFVRQIDRADSVVAAKRGRPVAVLRALDGFWDPSSFFDIATKDALSA